MSDYYTSWRRKGADNNNIIQRTVSYRDRASWQRARAKGLTKREGPYRDEAPKGSVSRSQFAVAREERLEASSSLVDRQLLYSDLYASANDSETYNAWDTGHEFLTQTWKCRRLRSLPLDEDGPSSWKLRFGIPSAFYPDDTLIACVPWEVARAASLGFTAGFPHWTSDSTTRKVRDLMVSRIQDALWAQCPDSISGSLGQDVVDVLAFGKQLDKLLTLRSRGVSLYKQYSQFSAKHRHEIDKIFHDLRRHPKAGLRSVSQKVGSTYLSWLFQYLPWWEDLQTLLDSATSDYLVAMGRTRERKIIGLGKVVNQIRDDDENGPMQAYLIDSSYLNQVCTTGESPRGTTEAGAIRTGIRDGQDAAIKFTASIVSVWGQNFEHGAVEPLHELNKKLGIVYPSLIWDLIPWSWLIEWFVKVGKFIDRSWTKGYGEWNCSYAYVTTKLASTYAGMTYLQTCRWPIHPSTELEVKAPQASALTSSQWGILAALGLSRRN